MEKETLWELIQSISTKMIEMSSNSKKNPLFHEDFFRPWISFLTSLQHLLTNISHNPEKWIEMQLAYGQDALHLFQSQYLAFLQGKPLPIEDKRFQSEEWLQHPFFHACSQHYLLLSQHGKNFMQQLSFRNKQEAKNLPFFVHQWLDALSPANFLQTNPQLLTETLQSQGKNLLLGFRNLLNDIEEDSARLVITRTDSSAFQVGKNLAATKGKVIFRNEMMELIQYEAQTKTVKSIPLLIIPPWINKYYILDLSKDNSFVQFLVQQGITVFMISWINPDASYKEKGLFDYLQQGPKAATKVICEQLQIPAINALGFCIGGTLLAALLAYNKAHQDSTIQTATFLASLIDFSEPGDISLFIDEEQIQRLEKTMQNKGFLEGQCMTNTFNSLRANDLIWSFFIRNYLRGQTPLPFDILFWNADATNMPAKMHSQYLRWMYLHNNLVKKNKIVLNHTPLDIHSIDIPTFFVSTRKDHIAPWQSTYLGFLQMKGEKQFILGESGHIAGIINPPCNKKYGFYYNPEEESDAETWLADAKHHASSWWPYWSKWLQAYSGKRRKAPQYETLPFAPITDAPGEYIHITCNKKPSA